MGISGMRKYLLDLNFNHKREEKKGGRRESGHVSDRIGCVMCVQEGVFSQLTVSISHLTDAELNELC